MVLVFTDIALRFKAEMFSLFLGGKPALIEMVDGVVPQEFPVQPMFYRRS